MDPTRKGRREEKKESDGTAGLILILLILIIVIAASVPALLPSGSAAADRLPIFLNIGGSSEGGEGGSGTGLRLSIITDLFNSLFAPEEGTFLLSSTGGTPGQVRTLPPEYTNTPSGRATETATPTGTVVAFGTVGPSPTPTMTGTPGPTKPATDTKDPQLSGGSMSPASGSSIACSERVFISGLVVHDPDHSSGINHVQLKYQIDGGGFVYGPELTLVSGGWTNPGKTWHATYDGGVKIDSSSSSNPGAVKVYAYSLAVQVTEAPTNTPVPTETDIPPPTFTPTVSNTPTPTSTPSITPTASATGSPTPTWTPDPTPSGTLKVEVYAYAEDNSGNSTAKHVATYYIPASCP